MLHALRDLAEQLHEHEQRTRQKQDQHQKSDDEGWKQGKQGAAAMVIATASVASVEGVKEGVASSAGDASTDHDRDRQMQALQAENTRLRQKLETLRQLLGVGGNPSGGSQAIVK